MSQDNININVTENIDEVNIVASEVVEVVDLNLYATTEDVSINVTEEIIQVNINKITSSDITKTSDLINDGADGTSTYVETEELGAVAFSNDYNDLDNLPTIPEAVTKTSDLINDGSDGVNKFITLQDIPAPITIDAVPTDGSSNAVSSNGVFDALATKQNVITNPVTGTGANGQVAFWNGTNSQSGDNGLFWDNTNKRLGVGTNAPTAILDLRKPSSITGLYVENLGSVSFPSAVFKNNQNTSYASIDILGGSLITNSNKFQFGQYSTGDAFFFLVGNNNLDFFTNSVNRIRITNTGNVGISTTNPQARLDVRAQGALSTDIAFRVRNSADTLDTVQVRGDGVTNFNLATGQSISFTHAGGTRLNLDGTSVAYRTGNRIILGGGNDFLDFSTVNSTRMTVNNLGNVSIGSTTAGARLDVRAQGALSTDIAFRVRNSADTFDVINVNGSQTTIINNDISSSTLRIRNNAVGRVLELLDINGNAFQWFDQSVARLANVSGTYYIARTQGTAAAPSYEISGLGGIGGANGMMMFAMGGNRRMFLTTSGQLRIPASNDFGQDLPHPSAKLQLDATTQGFLPPRMTNAQRLAIASPAVGLMVYCTDATEGLYINKSTGWTFII